MVQQTPLNVLQHKKRLQRIMLWHTTLYYMYYCIITLLFVTLKHAVHWDYRTRITMYWFRFSQQTQKLKQELLESHTNIAFLQSELDSLKSDLTDQSINLERWDFIFRLQIFDRMSEILADLLIWEFFSYVTFFALVTEWCNEQK